MKCRCRLLAKLSDAHGSVIIIVAAALVMILAFAALAVDLGYLMVVRNELQNAADAAAMALVRHVYIGAPPNWADAQNYKGWAISLNKATKTPLTDCQVQTGYWNLQTPSGLQPTTKIPDLYDAAAVMVTVSKSTGNNGGPVNLFFAPILGIKTQAVSAQAIAAIPSPGSVGSGELFPIAVAKETYDNPLYWDSNNRRPPPGQKLFANGPLDPQHTPKVGQWTSFKIDASDVSTIQGLITNKNPDPLAIGDDIWIEPGVGSGVYDPNLVGLLRAIVVVGSIAAHGQTPVLGFGAIQIDKVVPLPGNLSFLQFHFLPFYQISSGRPYGPWYGTATPSKLVR